jgi:hypothetical protein
MYRNDSEQRPDRPLRAHMNRRAIAVTGQLLMAGIWLERRLMNVPRRGLRWVETPERRALSTLVVRSHDTPVDPTRIEER